MSNITSTKETSFTSTTHGDLTERQYKELETVARLSPGYSFTVIRYGESSSRRGSTATHVQVWKDDNNVALVGKRCAQYYDGNNKETEAVVRRVAHRVYRLSGLRFE